MQNGQTLLALGFSIDQYGEYVFEANGVSLMAEVIECNGPIPYVQLYKVTNTVDCRPLSDFKGRKFRILIKDCCSYGSVERAIESQYEKERNNSRR